MLQNDQVSRLWVQKDIITDDNFVLQVRQDEVKGQRSRSRPDATWYGQLENVAITMYCLLMPPDAMPVLINLKRFAAAKHQRPNFDGCIYIHCLLHPLIRLASAPCISFRLAKFGWIQFSDLSVQRLGTKHAERGTYEGWIKTPVPF